MAQKRIIYTDQAFNDLNRIVDHVANNFTQDLAIDIYKEIHSAINTLLKFPKMGKSSRTHHLQRELVVKKNTIYYSLQDDDIVITTIRPRGTEK